MTLRKYSPQYLPVREGENKQLYNHLYYLKNKEELLALRKIRHLENQEAENEYQRNHYHKVVKPMAMAVHKEWEENQRQRSN